MDQGVQRYSIAVQACNETEKCSTLRPFSENKSQVAHSNSCGTARKWKGAHLFDQLIAEDKASFIREQYNMGA